MWFHSLLHSSFYSLNELSSPGLMVPSPRAKDHLTKFNTRHEKYPLLSCYSGLSKGLPKHAVYCYCPWLPPRGGREYLPIVEDTMYFRNRVQRPLGWNWSEWLTPSGLPFMVSEGSIEASKGARQTTVPTLTSYVPHQWLACHDNPDSVVVACHGGNQCLYNWT